MKPQHQQIAYFLMRVALGVNYLGHGVFRILAGVGAFAATTAAGIDKGPLPHGASLAFSYCVPWIELTLGVLLVCGLFTRAALVAASLFMVALMVGTTSIQNWAVAGLQLQYSFILFAMLWLVEANTLSLDSLWRKRPV